MTCLGPRNTVRRVVLPRSIASRPPRNSQLSANNLRKCTHSKRALPGKNKLSYESKPRDITPNLCTNACTYAPTHVKAASRAAWAAGPPARDTLRTSEHSGGGRRRSSRPSAGPTPPPAAATAHIAASCIRAAPPYRRGPALELQDLRAAHTRGGCERRAQVACGRGDAKVGGVRGEIRAAAAP